MEADKHDLYNFVYVVHVKHFCQTITENRSTNIVENKSDYPVVVFHY